MFWFLTTRQLSSVVPMLYLGPGNPDAATFMTPLSTPSSHHCFGFWGKRWTMRLYNLQDPMSIPFPRSRNLCLFLLFFSIDFNSLPLKKKNLFIYLAELGLSCKSKVKVFIAQSCLNLCDPMEWSPTPPSHPPTQAPLSMGFLRQEYWNGLSFPSPGELPDPGIEPYVPYVPCIGGQVLYH